MIRYIAKFQNKFASVRADHEKGATAVEYGLMVALIAAAIVVTVTALGGQLNALFTMITGAVTPPAG